MFHLARAGWLRWRDQLTETPPRPGKGPLALRLRLADGSGFDLTEAGTQRKLAVYVVADPASIPHVATLGPDPLSEEFDAETLRGLLQRAGRSQLKGVLKNQRVIAGIGNAYSDEILHAATMSPFKPASSLTDDELATLYAAIQGELTGAIERAAGLAAKDLRVRRRPGCACTAARGCPARSAGTPWPRCRSPTRRCSTAPAVRPAASCSPTGGCLDCSSDAGS